MQITFVVTMKSEEPGDKSFHFFRTSALLAVLLGAAGSLGLTLYTGRNNNSVFLMLLFSGWVLSPFIALFVADIISKRWTVPTRMKLYRLMLAVAVVSLIGYSGVLIPAETKPAFVFLIVPLASWILTAIFILIAIRLSRKV